MPVSRPDRPCLCTSDQGNDCRTSTPDDGSRPSLRPDRPKRDSARGLASLAGLRFQTSRSSPLPALSLLLSLPALPASFVFSSSSSSSFSESALFLFVASPAEDHFPQTKNRRFLVLQHRDQIQQGSQQSGDQLSLSLLKFILLYSLDQDFYFGWIIFGIFSVSAIAFAPFFLGYF